MSCDRCNGEGFIVTCFDDICQGMGQCIHGDGEMMCPACSGTGDGPDYDDDERDMDED